MHIADMNRIRIEGVNVVLWRPRGNAVSPSIGPVAPRARAASLLCRSGRRHVGNFIKIIKIIILMGF